MAVNVETLDKLERKITLNLPLSAIQGEVETRLKRLARTVKMDGFRPGKVPMNVVSQRYGYSVQYEVLNDKVGEAFAQAANEAQLRVAGQPRITEKQDAPEGEVSFDAIFEVRVTGACRWLPVARRVRAGRSCGAACAGCLPSCQSHCRSLRPRVFPLRRRPGRQF